MRAFFDIFVCLAWRLCQGLSCCLSYFSQIRFHHVGDKTRMMDLSRHPRAFVRPSPSKGILGGLSSYTNDVVTLCEAAGYDLVLVETVGLGQSEIDISQTVDMLILMVSPGGGDSLQVRW